MAGKWGVTFDCVQPAKLAAFWSLALGYVEAPPPPGFDTWPDWFVHVGVPEEEWHDGAYLQDPGGLTPGISFLKVPESKVAKNRVHLDVQISGGRSEASDVRRSRITEMVERLVEAGGTVIRADSIDGTLDHTVMADPEGNEFCVL